MDFVWKANGQFWIYTPVNWFEYSGIFTTSGSARNTWVDVLISDPVLGWQLRCASKIWTMACKYLTNVGLSIIGWTSAETETHNSKEKKVGCSQCHLQWHQAGFALLFLRDEAPASCSVVCSLWSVLFSHNPLPVLRLSSFSLCLSLSLSVLLLYIPSLSSLLHPFHILIFSWSTRCVFKVYRCPPGIEDRGWAWGGRGFKVQKLS